MRYTICHVHGSADSILLGCKFSPKMIHRANAIPIKVLLRFFVESDKLILKLICKRPEQNNYKDGGLNYDISRLIKLQ